MVPAPLFFGKNNKLKSEFSWALHITSCFLDLRREIYLGNKRSPILRRPIFSRPAATAALKNGRNIAKVNASDFLIDVGECPRILI
jgi:hypothetical protein